MIDLNLHEIRGSYDLIVSLGSACGPASHLRRHNLRRFSMPFDWVVSNSLSDVNRLLENNFKGFMDLKNMSLIEGSDFFVRDEVVQPVKSYFIKDTFYNIISVHDFPVIKDQDWTETYPSYKEKLNMRINRFLEALKNSHSVLFVRWAGCYDDVVELQSVLSKMIKNKFNILILVPSDTLQGVAEINWGLDRVCSIMVPNRSADNSIWDYLLNGITLTNR